MRCYLILVVLTLFVIPSIAQDVPLHPSQAPDSGIPQTQANEETSQNNSDEEKPEIPLKDRIFFGGSFGLSFGTYTYINISPLIGYKLSPRFSVASGIIYQYTKDKFYDYSYSTYGARAMGIAKIYGPIFAQLEYEYLNYQAYNIYGEEYRNNYNSVLGGGGIAQPISNKVYFTAVVLYNFTYNVNSYYSQPYGSPWVFRVGISAGF